MKKIMILFFVAALVGACSGKKNDVAQNHTAVDASQEEMNAATEIMDAVEEVEESMPADAMAASEEPAKKERSKTWSASAETPSEVDSDIPVDEEKLFAYLQSKQYQKFAHQEKEMHPSQGPHTNYGLPVRSYFNDKVAESLKAGNKEHPEGAGIIKEMFTDAGELAGWAVMVKTQATADNGKGWFWYEVTSTSDNSFDNIPGVGNGVPGCVGCHAIGTDMVRTDFSTI